MHLFSVASGSAAVIRLGLWDELEIQAAVHRFLDFRCGRGSEITHLFCQVLFLTHWVLQQHLKNAWWTPGLAAC